MYNRKVQLEMEFDKEINFTKEEQVKGISEIILNVCSGKYIVPKAQRKYVWDRNKQSNFIYDLLFNYNEFKMSQTNKITLITKKNGEYFDIIDGQQRISSILDFFYTSNAEIDQLHNESMKDLVKIYQKKTNRKKILNLDIEQLGLKLKTPNIRTKDNTIKKIINGKQASDFDEKLIRDALNRTIEFEIITVESEDDYIHIMKKLFITMNANVEVTESEKMNCLFYDNDYYKNKMELADKLGDYIHIKDKTETKLINILIDFDRAQNGEYTASYKLKEKFIRKKNNDLDYIKKSQELTYNITNIIMDIFGEEHVLTEYNITKNKWNNTTNAAIILPWYLAIEELLVTGVQENIFKEKREKILNNWKEIKIGTGRESIISLNNKWLINKTDHSANKNKVINRKNIIIELLIDAIA